MMVDEVEARRRFFAELTEALVPFAAALGDETSKTSTKLEGRSYPAPGR